MSNVDIATEDAYLAEPLSEVVARSNRAASVCERAAGILAEQGEDKRAQALVAYKRAREAASMAAKANRAANMADKRAERYRMGVLAARFCEAAEVEAQAFAALNIDPDGVWTEPGAEVADAAEQVREAANLAECGAAKGKRASAGRYNKGCRCEACKRAYTTYRAAKRAK